MKVICPKCKSEHTAPIMYGMPSYEGFQAAERGEVILGGCMIVPRQPDYGCLDCKHQWSKKSMPATAITKVRFKMWENGPCFIDLMKKWVYEIYPDGKMVCYTYYGTNKKYKFKDEATGSQKKVIEFYRKLKKALYAEPNEIIIAEVCDGCSFNLQVSFSDGRKEILNGDIGGGTIDDLLMDYLNEYFEEE